MKRLLAALLSLSVVSCATETATTAVIDNGYPSADGGAGQVVVYRGFWFVTVFLGPVLPGAESETERTVLGSDIAYAVLAPGWDPSSGRAPSALIPVQSIAPLAVERGDTLHVTITPSSFRGDCSTGSHLSQDEANFITQRIFPGDFAGYAYDATTCTLTPISPVDGGAD